MRITLKNGNPASEGAIEALESALGVRLSESYRAFLGAQDGAKPENNLFEGNDNVGINGFIPLAEVMKERAYIENLPERAYPVAWSAGGNYAFIDEDRDGSVFFWDHEEPEKITELAVSFGAFLELLEPFDISKIELKPGQVKRVWVRPGFLERLKK
jgi:SMI1 / KNR4 family (SUKH-1)